MSAKEPTTVGLSDDANAILKEISERLGFDKGQDIFAFKLAVAIALVLLPAPDQCPDLRGLTTKYNIGSLDSGGKLYRAVSLFSQNYSGSIYKLVERLADWGIRWIRTQIGDRDITVRDLLGAVDLARANRTPAGT